MSDCENFNDINDDAKQDAVCRSTPYTKKRFSQLEGEFLRFAAPKRIASDLALQLRYVRRACETSESLARMIAVRPTTRPLLQSG
jgi:hypothetical protein